MKKILGLFIFLYVLLINTALGYSLTVNGFYIDGIEGAQTVTVTAPKNIGYDFENWEVESGDLTLSNSNSNPMSFMMPNGDASIYSTYIQTVIDTSLYGSNLGDIDGDSKISMSDVVLLSHYLDGSEELSEGQLLRADVNGDGRIDGFDNKLIMALVSRDIEEWPINIRLGDVNLDEKINSTDSIQVKQFSEEKKQLSVKQLLAGDINLDGSVDKFDSKLIMQFYLGNIDSLPVDILCGDVNGDGKVNEIDSLWVNQYLVGGRTLPNSKKLCADVNVDGKIDRFDDYLIYLKYNGRIPRLPVDVVCGDVNRDGVVNSEDALLIINYLDGLRGLTENQKLSADVNLDGVIDSTDAELIHEYYLKNIPKLPQDIVYGDVNGDGVVNAEDLSLISSYINGTQESSDNQRLYADVNLDGKVNEIDKNLIQQYVDGSITNLPVISGTMFTWDTTGQLTKSITVRTDGPTKINWGDGAISNVASSPSSNLTLSHTYASGKNYTVVIEDDVVIYLNCNNSKISELNVERTTELEELYCNNNQLTSLDVSSNVALTKLNCNNNQLTKLEVSKNTALTSLLASGNQLVDLDVSNNRLLTELYVETASLAKLDVSNNLYIGTLSISNLDLLVVDKSFWNNCHGFVHNYANSITITQTEHGKITYDSGYKFKITPDIGSTVLKIFVDGVLKPSATTYDFESLNNQEVEITAVFGNYLVEYNANNGTGAPLTQGKVHGKDLTLSNVIPTYEGHTFRCWNTEQNGSGTSYVAGATYTANESVTLYAQWGVRYTLTNQTYTNGASSTTGGSWTGANTYDTGSTVSIVATANSGYAFRGWTVVSGTATGINTSAASTSFTISGDVTLRANFAQTYIVSYDANNGSGAPSAQTKYHGETLTLSSTEPTRSGYRFTGWNTAADGSGTAYAAGATYTANAAATLYAQWIARYTVTAQTYTNGISSTTGGSWTGAGTYDSGTTVTITATANSGYRFAGWTQPSGTQVLANANSATTTFTITGNTTLRANFVKTYTVTAQTYTNGSSSTTGGSWTGAGTYDTGTVVTITATVNPGYQFVYWYETSGSNIFANRYSTTTTFTITDNVTIRAYFKTASYTITYVKNPNWQTSYLPTAQIKYYNQDITLATDIPKCSSNLFTGWNTAQDGTGTTYLPGATYTANESVTLYSQWREVARGSYVTYTAGDYTGKWLLAQCSSINTILISKDSVGDITLTGAEGYANAKQILQNKADQYLNPTYYAIDAFAAGSNIDYLTIDTSEYPLTYEAATASPPYKDTTASSSWIEGHPEIQTYNGYTWMGKRDMVKYTDSRSDFCVYKCTSTGSKIRVCLYSAYADGRVATYSVTAAVRPLISLDNRIKITGGSGTETDPYILGLW